MVSLKDKRGKSVILRSENKREQWLGLGLILIGAGLRMLPHPDNFTPVTAIALFSGVVLPPSIALTLPLIVMISTDLIIGPHPLFWLVWGAFSLVSLLGVWLRGNSKPRTVIFGTVAGSVLFFVLTNLGVFLFENMYPHTREGLARCFTMALPFFRNSLLGDLFYSAVFFGIFATAKLRAPAGIRG